MTRFTAALISFCIFSFLTGCKNDDGVTTPTDLTLNTTISEDGSGLVSFAATATHATYYEYLFGDVQNETPRKVTDGNATHIYSQSGTYEIKVTAYANEKLFISESRTITVQVFVAIPSTGYSTPTSYAGMTALWADEFSGSTLDSKWKFENGDGCPAVCGWGNNELEYYREQNTKLQDGYLILEAKSESYSGKYFTSSKLVTKGTVSLKYGRVDVRSALPEGQGIWPAIWMLGSNIDAVGWPKCGEVDIMEMIGGSGRENTVYGTAHWDNAGTYASYGGHYTLPQGIFKDKFHVFSIAWDSNKITWYVDDIKYHEIDITPAELNEFQKEFYFILNLAVGGNWPGNPSGSTTFPQRMIVDYIRVFQKV